MAKRKPYPAEFKQEAVKLVTEQGLSRSQVARDFGSHPDTLRYWLQKQAPDRNTPSELAVNAAELNRLRRENEQLRLERDILKKPSASSRGCHNDSKVSIRGRPCELLPDYADVPGFEIGQEWVLTNVAGC